MMRAAPNPCLTRTAPPPICRPQDGGDTGSLSRFSQATGSDATAGAASAGKGGGAAIVSPPSIQTLSTLQATLLVLLAGLAWVVACSGAALLAWLMVSR
jgi:hypothetical protein